VRACVRPRHAPRHADSCSPGRLLSFHPRNKLKPPRALPAIASSHAVPAHARPPLQPPYWACLRAHTRTRTHTHHCHLPPHPGLSPPPACPLHPAAHLGPEQLDGGDAPVDGHIEHALGCSAGGAERLHGRGGPPSHARRMAEWKGFPARALPQAAPPHLEALGDERVYLQARRLPARAAPAHGWWCGYRRSIDHPDDPPRHPIRARALRDDQVGVAGAREVAHHRLDHRAGL
jgi:hypothetical protein